MSSSDPSTSSDLLRNARFAPSSSSSGSAAGQDDFLQQAPTSSQLLAGGGAASLHPLANLQKQDLEYLTLDDSKLSDLEGGQTVLPSRGWSDELCYGTGTTYLAGLSAGGLWGLREGLARSRRLATAAATSSSAAFNKVAQQASAAASAAAASSLNTNAANPTPPPPSATTGNARTQPAQPASSTAAAGMDAAASAAKTGPATTANRSSPAFRVRLNAVLNSVTRRGTFVGNNAGVLALIYNAFNSSIDKYRGRHDIYGSMLAGASTGLIWKSTAGLRPMFIASAGMTAGAALWTTVKPALV